MFLTVANIKQYIVTNFIILNIFFSEYCQKKVIETNKVTFKKLLKNLRDRCKVLSSTFERTEIAVS